jgi:sialidase-1
VNISPSVIPDSADWRWYANTPGHAVQLPSGRLFIPANHSAGPPVDRFLEYRAHAFHSDDHGRTFQRSADIPFPGSNECSAAYLPDGGVLLSIRDQSKTRPFRLIATSSSEGNDWDTVRFAPDLPDPVCQGSLLNFEGTDGRMYWLHSNPAHPDERCCLTVKWSRDAGSSWQVWREIYGGSAAYSDLVRISPAKAGVLFERDGYSEIAFVSFPGPATE